MPTGRVGAIVVGAGAGRRVGGVEKAFMDVAGRPLLCWSVEVFERAAAVDEVCLVVAGPSVERAQRLVRERGWAKVSAVVAGGQERQDSVGAGLAPLQGCEWVLVHDAARPLVSEAMVRAGLDAARRHGAAVAATAVRDTLKRVPPGGEVVQETVERSGLWAAQTPQVFRASLLRDAFRQAGAGAGRYTDDAALVAAMGHPVAVFPGGPENVKLTHPEDLPLVETLLRSRLPDGPGGGGEGAGLRAGTGYDLHRLVSGRPLILGGVTVPYHLGLAGHSDGDALAHAVTDALLGACALGDIGQHFPPGDPAYRDAHSLDLLRAAAALATRAGWRVVNLDATVVCERPRLAPYLPEMQAALAGTLEVPPSAVSIKAKTNEGLDAVGRGEAVAAQAILLVVAAPLPGALRAQGPGHR
jgi:2-C-methyl-D-erythritol 4-phosphate cytidylyltransferase/2-C-methyl-D-erythritol 2,4-cyclodiphosphate synthase